MRPTTMMKESQRRNDGFSLLVIIVLGMSVNVVVETVVGLLNG